MKPAALCCLALASTLACGSTARSRGGAGATDGASGAATDGASGAAAGGAAAVDAASSCQPPAPALIRLSFPELVDSMRGLLGEEVGGALASELDVQGEHRAFPALASERPYIDDHTLGRTEMLAQWVGRHARNNFASVTGCPPDYGCVRDFVAELADRAFRRPLSTAEEQALLLTVDRAEALEASPEVAAEYGVQAVFTSPHFLYRTELGVPAEPDAEELLLTDHELASELSFFVTGRAPDALLRAAADAGELASAAGISEQVERLLREPVARLHLQSALAAYLKASQVQTVVLDPEHYPTWSSALANSMRRELDALFERTVAGTSPAAALLTTRAARVDPSLAALYGIEFPPPGSPPDASGFADVELPEARAGLLTRGGWSVIHTNPDGPEILRRGLAVRALVLCDSRLLEQEHPAIPPPDASSDAARARVRLADPACAACHAEIDSFGLALDDLDALGRWRAQNPQGGPIDASATLPDVLGGAPVRGATELSRALPAKAFAACLAQELLGYALGSEAAAQRGEACRSDELAIDAEATLPDIVEQVVRSRRFSVRQH